MTNYGDIRELCNLSQEQLGFAVTSQLLDDRFEMQCLADCIRRWLGNPGWGRNTYVQYLLFEMSMGLWHHPVYCSGEDQGWMPERVPVVSRVFSQLG